MHEMSIAEALIDQVGRYTPVGSRVSRALVEVGALQSIDVESLRFAWQALTAGSSLEGAALSVRQLPWKLQCSKCRRAWNSADPFERCACGNDENNPTGSNELHLVSIEVKPEDALPLVQSLQPEYQA